MLKIMIFNQLNQLESAGAAIINKLISRKPEAKLGLATGSSPVGIYNKLVETFRQGHISFKRVTTYNLDEYIGLSADHPQSFAAFMQNHFFQHIDILEGNVHIPKGDAVSPEEECIRYETLLQEAQSLDLQLLGIGLNGHIGFNEPGWGLSCETHIIELSEETRTVNARWFDSLEDTPRYAITMGLGGIMKSKEVLLVVQGEAKSEIVEQALTGPLTTDCPGSLLQLHPNLTVLLDKEVASKLTANGTLPYRMAGAKKITFSYSQEGKRGIL